jgi:hypothetical protein
VKTANEAVRDYQQALKSRLAVLDEYREVRARLDEATLGVDRAASFLRYAKLPKTMRLK